MVLALVSLSAREGEQIAVSFEIRNGEDIQREQFLVPASLVADLRLVKGEVDRACYDAVVRGSELHAAIKRGLGILSYGSASERMLCRKLQMKGIRREIAEEAVEALRRQGYLNPAEDALREADRCIRKLWGRRRIVSALLEKGYSRAVIQETLESLSDDGVDFVEVCAERLRTHVGAVPADLNDRRKLVASLMRYGFENDEIREAFRLISSRTK